MSIPSPPSETIVPPRQTPAPVLWLLRALALAAAGVAVYLLVVALREGKLPIGCGAGSGCAEVLTSQWSRIGSVPVSAPALALYLGLFAATWFIGGGQPPARQRAAWIVLLILSAAIAASAAWFIALQAFDLKAFCPWCMADHALGLSFATIVCWHAPFRWGAKPADDEAALAGGAALRLAIVGAGLAGTLAMLQLALPYRPTQTIRLPAGENGDTGPGPNRAVALLSGKLQLSPHEQPTLGSPDAPQLAVILLDYCCPHCRETHGQLLKAVARYGDQFAVVALPMPLNRDCNPHVQRTEDRFRNACVLARLALAVWRADPVAWRKFDAWLFEAETPREPKTARKKALELVSLDALERAQSDPWINEQLERNMEAYHDSGAERIPVVLSPAAGFEAIVGRPESEFALFRMLEEDLGLKPSADPAGGEDAQEGEAPAEPGDGEGGEHSVDAASERTTD